MERISMNSEAIAKGLGSEYAPLNRGIEANG